MATVRAYEARFREGAKYYASGAWRLLNERPVFLWSQAIAFKVLVTIVPIVILATGILGRVLQGNAFDTVARYIRDFVPYQSNELIGLLRQLQSGSTTFTLVGFFGLLFSVMTLFTSLRVVVSSIFQEEWHEQRTVLRGYAFDIRMGLQVGLLFLLSFGLSLGMNALDAAGAEFFEQIGFTNAWLVESWKRFFYTFGLLFPLILTVGMFFQLFYFVPRPHPPRRSALLGAVVAALLFDAAKYAFTFYATRAGRFSRYQITDPEAGGADVFVGAFGLVIAFVFWVYYSGLVLCIGGIFSLLHERRHRAQRKQKHAGQVPHAAEGGEEERQPPRRGLPTPGDVLARRRRKAREDISVG